MGGDEPFFAGGSLKLKGGTGAGVTKKKKKSKLAADASKAVAATGTTAASSSEVVTSAPVATGRTMTAAELRFEEIRRQRLAEKTAKTAQKSHKEKVAEFNSYLDKLSEHHDIPKVGPG